MFTKAMSSGKRLRVGRCTFTGVLFEVLSDFQMGSAEISEPLVTNYRTNWLTIIANEMHYFSTLF